MSAGASWHCQLCGNITPPLVGPYIAGARHHCRSCGQTCCDDCSTVPHRGVRTCRDCYLNRDDPQTAEQPREKYVFLVRHAQSTWNQNVDLAKSFRNCSLDGMSIQHAVKQMGTLVAKEVWHRDHPISEEGLRQTKELRGKILACTQSTGCLQRGAHCPEELHRGTATSSDNTGSTIPESTMSDSAGLDNADAEQERVRRFYSTFLDSRQQIYCSPLLRALQTAHLVLPCDDGWGPIKLLKDARERFSFILERDCLGTGVGADIVDRAMQMGQELPGLQDRVDATDCAQKWWSDEPESEAEVEARLQNLWKRLLEEDADDGCVLVTHSNLIKALVMRFGSIDEDACLSPVGQAGISAAGHARAEPFPQQTDGCEEAVGVVFDEDSDGGEDAEAIESWQVVGGSSDRLRRLKVERLQNCGVLGLRCVREAPVRALFPEVDGWVDLTCDSTLRRPALAEPQWTAKDALLMFDSVLVK